MEGEDPRVPGEEGWWGCVQDRIPAHPQTSAGTFGALGFCAVVICHEKDVNQGVTDPEDSGTPRRRTRTPLPDWNQTDRSTARNRAAPDTYKPIGRRMFVFTSLNWGMVCYTTLLQHEQAYIFVLNH